VNSRTMYRNWLSLCTFVVVSLLSLNAHAVPSFARQTGQNCATCHTSWQELTPFGRHFKLTGYTIGERSLTPVAVMGQIGATSTDNPNDASGAPLVRKDGDPRFSLASLFVAGKATDNIGTFIQWTFEHTAPSHSHVDNVDIRGAWNFSLADKELILGATLHNNPTVQDVWNSTPAWGFPYTQSPDAISIGSPVTTQIEGGLSQLVAGTGAYAWWNRSFYGELTFYRTADGVFSPMRAGILKKDQQTLVGENPYWRFAYSKDWGPHSIMLGTYGMHVKMYSDPQDRTSPTNKFTDTALDAQYQYITDQHVFTAQGTLIHEKQNLWDSTDSVYLSDHLNTVKGKITYYYQRKYGGTLGLFSTTGNSDPLNSTYGFTNTLDSNNAQITNGNSSPNSRGYIAELDYLPMQNVRLMLQYNGYWKYLGASTNVDNNGRRASDNNSLFMNLWFLF